MAISSNVVYLLLWNFWNISISSAITWIPFKLYEELYELTVFCKKFPFNSHCNINVIGSTFSCMIGSIIFKFSNTIQEMMPHVRISLNYLYNEYLMYNGYVWDWNILAILLYCSIVQQRIVWRILTFSDLELNKHFRRKKVIFTVLKCQL